MYVPKKRAKLQRLIRQRFGAQWHFAKTVGCHDSLVSKILVGASDLTEFQRERWAEVLDIPVDDQIFEA